MTLGEIQDLHELMMDYRGAIFEHAHGRYLDVMAFIEARERKAFEAGRDRNPGYHSWDSNSGYSSCDPEMRGTTYHPGEAKYLTFEDYKNSPEYLE